MWFDPDKDSGLLHASVRSDPELDNAASKAEFDLFAAYTECRNGEFVVCLKGYDEDPEKADPHLRAAVKRAIADIVSYRLRGYGDPPGVSSMSQGNRSVQFAGSSAGWSGFPKGWQRTLTPFDQRTQLYHA